MSVSAIIHTYNAATTLHRALRSVAWADQIVIIDMESTDQTVEIARAAGAEVHTVKHQDYADPARNFGLQQAKGDWIVVLDADEELPEKLITELQAIMMNPTQIVAYYLPRQNVIFGHSMQYTGWWPDYQLRFFRRGVVTWPKEVHGQPTVSGSHEYFPADPGIAIVHYNYPTVTSFIERLDRYTTIKAAEPLEKPRPPRPFIAFGNEFLRRYFALEGWNEGVHGSSLSLLQAMYEMVVELKRWEKVGFSEQVNDTTQLADLTDFSRQMQYWLADWHMKQSTGLKRLYWQVRRKLLS